LTQPLDRQLLDGIDRATLRGRALLCTLARLGKAMQLGEPARARILLAVSQANPLYKGGRMLFDLLELEDLMLDGPPPTPLDSEELAKALRELTGGFAAFARALERISLDLSGHAGNDPERAPLAAASETLESAEVTTLPEIDASDYLYDFVILGTLHELSRALASRVPEHPEAREAG
jgi:hypothetical protein